MSLKSKIRDKIVRSYPTPVWRTTIEAMARNLPSPKGGYYKADTGRRKADELAIDRDVPIQRTKYEGRDAYVYIPQRYGVLDDRKSTVWRRSQPKLI